MSITAILLWILTMLGFGGPACGDVAAETMQLTSACVVHSTEAHPQSRRRFTNDISNGI